MNQKSMQNKKVTAGVLLMLLVTAVICLACGCGKAKVVKKDDDGSYGTSAETELSKEAALYESSRPQMLESSENNSAGRPEESCLTDHSSLRPEPESSGTEGKPEALESSGKAEADGEETHAADESRSSRQDLGPREPSADQPQVPSNPELSSKPSPEPNPEPSQEQADTSDASQPPHQHTWQPVLLTVHHDAVTKEVWVVDVPAHQEKEEVKEWHKQCDGCGAILDNMSQEEVDLHMMDHMDRGEPSSYGDRLVDMGSRLIWVAEVGHTETAVVKEAYDSIAFGGLVCTGCGQKRTPDQVPNWRDYMPEGWTEN